MKKRLRIIFMGTPEFAVPALNALADSGNDIVLVVTQPDRPKGRGRKLISSPVKIAARKLGLDILQPVSIKEQDFEDKIKDLAPDLFVTTAFGQILTESLLAIPRIYAINVHASLLPKYRGAAPIQWAIINGEKETGVTIMKMDKRLDTGDLLLASKTDIRPDDTSATLHDRLAVIGADLLKEILMGLEKGEIHAVPQDHTYATYTPLLKKKDGRIPWEKPAGVIEAFIRGMTPWPGAFTFHGKKRLKIFSAHPVLMDTDEKPGTVLKSFPDELRVATGKNSLSLLEIQGESGKRLPIKNFLMGNKIPPGETLG